jgi:hypothetical protein
MEPRCSLPCSKNQPLDPISGVAHFNIIFSSTARLPKVLLGLPDHNYGMQFLFIFLTHVTCPVHLILLYIITLILVLFKDKHKLRIFQLCKFLHLLSFSLRSKQFPQPPVLKRYLSTYFPYGERPSFTPMQELKSKISALYYSVLRYMILNRRRDARQQKG